MKTRKCGNFIENDKTRKNEKKRKKRTKRKKKRKTRLKNQQIAKLFQEFLACQKFLNIVAFLNKTRFKRAVNVRKERFFFLDFDTFAVNLFISRSVSSLQRATRNLRAVEFGHPAHNWAGRLIELFVLNCSDPPRSRKISQGLVCERSLSVGYGGNNVVFSVWKCVFLKCVF